MKIKEEKMKKELETCFTKVVDVMEDAVFESFEEKKSIIKNSIENIFVEVGKLNKDDINVECTSEDGRSLNVKIKVPECAEAVYTLK